MASPLLETKLCAPRPRRVLVPRPRLRQRLDQGTQTSLTLVSAPAGSGKTTLLAASAMATPPAERRTAWLAPAQVHLVIAGRADPALPLARLRARGELVEIRAADLRFTPDEAGAFLTEVMGRGRVVG